MSSSFFPMGVAVNISPSISDYITGRKDDVDMDLPPNFQKTDLKDTPTDLAKWAHSELSNCKETNLIHREVATPRRR